jgi:hypothetical protein
MSAEERKLCPLPTFHFCQEGRCAWFDPGEKACAVKLIASYLSYMYHYGVSVEKR